jgi:endonuclease/exonuclease/phosphatase family metal-dependent hydrolase
MWLATAVAGDELTVVSLNAWGLPAPLAPDRAARMGSLGAWIDTLDADLVGLQELWDGAVPLVDLDLTLSRDGGDDGLAMVSGHHLEEVGVRRFRDARSFDALKRKGILRARLVRPSGPDVWVFVTHLQAGYGRANAAVRERQLAELSAWLAETQGPVLVLGDFNVDERHPEDAPFLETVGRLGLVDAAAAVGVTDGTYPGDGRRYDRVFARDGGGWRITAEHAAVVQYGVAGGPERLSDHLPLVVRLRVDRAEEVGEAGTR